MGFSLFCFIGVIRRNEEQISPCGIVIIFLGFNRKYFTRSASSIFFSVYRRGVAVDSRNTIFLNGAGEIKGFLLITKPQNTSKMPLYGSYIKNFIQYYYQRSLYKNIMDALDSRMGA